MLARAGALHADGRGAEASDALATALALAPNDVDVRVEAARIERRVTNFGAARAHLVAATRMAPTRADLKTELAEVVAMSGDLVRAGRLFELVLRAEPEDARARSGLACVLERRGAFGEALALVRPLVESGDASIDATVTYAACLLRGAGDGGARDALAELDRRVAVDPRAASSSALAFARGDCLDRLERFDEAFEAYRRANDAGEHRYDPFGHAREVEDTRSTFVRPSFERRPRALVHRPHVLIVGMPRSGTSLVEQVLAAHPRVCARGEREELRLLADVVKSDGASDAMPGPGRWSPGIDALTQTKVDEMAEWYEAQLGADVPAGHTVVEKLPENYLHLGLVAHVVPNAIVVHCRRDPRDTCLSCYFQSFGARQPFSSRLDWLAARYRAYAGLMKHWESALPLPLHTVEYEAFVEDPEGEIAALLDACGLEWDAACLAPERVERTVATASYAQVERPIHTGAVARWRHYEAHLGPLAGLVDAL